MAVATIDLTSKELKMNTLLTVCFPDSVRIGTRPLSERKVLWLLHGLSDDGTSWLRYSRIDQYAAENDLVVVMPSAGRSMYCDDVNGQNYFSFIADELPEYLSLVFGLSRRKEDNLIAGLSMGGMGAARIALTYPERYAALGSLSGVLHLAPLLASVDDTMKREFPFMLSALPNPEGSPLNPAALLDAQKDRELAIYLACGLQDDLLLCTRLFQQKAHALGIETECVYEDGSHNWDFWDRHIRLFLDFALKGKQ